MAGFSESIVFLLKGKKVKEGSKNVKMTIKVLALIGLYFLQNKKRRRCALLPLPRSATKFLK